MDYKDWYVVTVGTNKENATKAQMLARKAVFGDRFLEEVEFLSRKEITIQKSGKRTVRNKLLMPGYLLVKVRKTAVEDEEGNQTMVFPSDTFNLITGTPGVQRFANCDRDEPIPMRPKEAKKIFDMCDDAHLEVKQNLQADYQEGDILDVVSGPFAGFKCEVISISGQKIHGQLDMFGRQVPAEFSLDQVYKK
jgi:transcription antitermination factor NusG